PAGVTDDRAGSVHDGYGIVVIDQHFGIGLVVVALSGNRIRAATCRPFDKFTVTVVVRIAVRGVKQLPRVQPKGKVIWPLSRGQIGRIVRRAGRAAVVGIAGRPADVPCSDVTSGIREGEKISASV